ncbi:MAG: integrase family protein [Casimicrobiaceae bacterium]
MATRTILSDAGIRAALAKAKKTGRPVWKSDGAIPKTHGGLQLFAHPNGAPRWYWRYTRPDGTKARIALGVFTAEKKKNALTLTEARAEVTRKVALYQNKETRDVRAHLDREDARIAAEKEAAERAQRAALAAEAAAGEHTFERLFATYVAHLRKQGKSSAGAAENMFKLHVAEAHPVTVALPANVVTARDVVAILRALTEIGKGRTAGKLRSYLRAAYALAARAALDSDAPAAFLPFNVEGNPVQATAALAQYNRALDRALSDPELREYWAALQMATDSPARDAALLLLLLGGQRPAQLARATVADVDLHAKTLRLHDPKGKRTQPRVHTLPLSEMAVEVVKRCMVRAEAQKGAWLFSTHGKAPLRPETLTEATREIAAALVAKPKAQRIVREAFQLRDIRRTCETALARMGVSKDVRAQIQSRGLGGIQARHYDRHDYMPEKAAALAAWAKHLQTAPADNVAHIGERRARRGRR